MSPNLTSMRQMILTSKIKRKNYDKPKVKLGFQGSHSNINVADPTCSFENMIGGSFRKVYKICVLL